MASQGGVNGASIYPEVSQIALGARQRPVSACGWIGGIASVLARMENALRHHWS